jgi:hypothetical protein
MSNLRFADAAYPSGISGGPFDGVAFYAGGDTPHIWTPAEVGARPERYRLPVWVRSNPQGTTQALADATELLHALPRYGTPAGILIALDSETSADPAYVRAFVEAVNRGGHKVIDYGSESRVHGNDNPDGLYWGADWTSVPHLHSGDGATQYVSFSGYDLSLMSSALPFWDAHPPAKPVPPPQSAADASDFTAIAIKLDALGVHLNTITSQLEAIDGKLAVITNQQEKIMSEDAAVLAVVTDEQAQVAALGTSVGALQALVVALQAEVTAGTALQPGTLAALQASEASLDTLAATGAADVATDTPAPPVTPPTP